MYSRRTKIFFGFMVFVMGIGFPLSLLVGLPAFQGLFGLSAGTDNATQELVEDAREDVRRLDCADEQNRPKGEDLKKCKRALETLGSGYRTLAAPTDDQGVEVPPDAERNQQKSLEAFELLYRIDPKDQDSREFLASAYQQSGKYAKALPLFRQLAKDRADDPDYLFAWASTAQAANETDEAIRAYRQFLKAAPDDPRAETVKEQIKTLKEGPPANAGAAGAAGAGGGINLG